MTNATAMLTALGDPTRQAILDQLTHGPWAVGQLADELPVSRPVVSQRLRVLKEVGLAPAGSRGAARPPGRVLGALAGRLPSPCRCRPAAGHTPPETR